MKIALLTNVRNEKVLLFKWFEYYTKFFQDDDIYVIDNNSDDDSVNYFKEKINFHVITEKEKIKNSDYITRFVKKWHYFLLYRYDVVLFAQADEFIVPDPKFFKDLTEYLQFFVNSPKKFIVTTGYNVLHDIKNEKPIVWNKPLLMQRKCWNYSGIYCKPLLSKCALDWDRGFHSIRGIHPHIIGNLSDPLLLNIHIRRIDWDLNLFRWKKEKEEIFTKELSEAVIIPDRFKEIL